MEKPQFTPNRKYKMPVAIIEIEDKDILKFVTGGLHGFQALNENRIKIAGDVALALSLEEGMKLIDLVYFQCSSRPVGSKR
ncbi:hypothetical protein HDV03_001389 [Kappamyces sp. JEL0829]|nr:hypothetical protein HDV03_001389 [Kappamyces sp. JEL0829]